MLFAQVVFLKAVKHKTNTVTVADKENLLPSFLALKVKYNEALSLLKESSLPLRDIPVISVSLTVQCPVALSLRVQADKLDALVLKVSPILPIKSDVFVQQHPAKDGQGFRGERQLASDEVNTDGVPFLHGQDDVEDSQSSRYVFGLSHWLLQAFRLIPS